VGTFTLMMQYKFLECIEIVGNPAQITSPNTLFWLRVLFGRMRSRWFGALTEVRLPVGLRAPLFRLFAWTYDVDLEEVRYPLDSFRTFNDFFCRVLADGARPISDLPTGLVSPVDGRVLTSGVIRSANARVEQVKGATYSVPAFLGQDPMESKGDQSLVRYIVLYLAPGDYHRIHAPCQVKFSQGRHFCGELLPLKQSLLRKVDDIFAVNERVVLSGDWRHGQMHLVAVGATNVGNIYLDFDEKLKTNRLRDITVHCGGDVSRKLYPEGVSLDTGSHVGGFRLGSTVVLVFDAPECFEWKVKPGDSIRVGEPLGDVAE
jgi:phosphatidylserine decarboxylase